MAGKPNIAEVNAKILAEKKKAEIPKEMPKSTTAKPVVVVVMAGYHTPIYHPYQRRWVPEVIDCPEGVEMPLDSWLQCQIDAGLVKVL